ncbi:MAG: hypothetical protein ABJA81_10440 [Nocardioidaceae bacterium]
MTASNSQFRVVMRGYDPSEVDRRIDELTSATQSSQQQVQEVSERLREVEQAYARAIQEAKEERTAAPPSFSELGERVGQILVLAEEEAAAIRASSKSDFETQQQLAEDAADRVRAEADRYAELQRSTADSDAARTSQDARRQADEMLDGADRDASARIQEAEAIHETQRAKAAQAAADFETTLAKRRDTSEQEFKQQFGASQSQLTEAQARVEQTRAEAEKLGSDAELQARRLIEDAQQRAEVAVAQGMAHADRIRAESERELTAATQRRDSINAQLTNVRQMLATLSGAAPVGLVGLDEHMDDASLEADTATGPDADDAVNVETGAGGTGAVETDADETGAADLASADTDTDTGAEEGAAEERDGDEDQMSQPADDAETDAEAPATSGKER